MKKTLTDIIEGKTWSAFIILLHQYLSNFCNLIEKFDEKEYPVKVYKTLIEARWGELKEFEKYYDELKKFLDYFCNWNHKYNLKDQEVALRELFSQTGLNLYIFQPLNNYVQTCSIDKIAGHIDDQLLKTHSLPVVTYFRGIDANIIEEIQKFNALEKKNCKLFDKFFNENSLKLNKEIDLRLIVDKLWPQAKNDLMLVAKRIESGEVTLIEIDDYLEFYGTEDKLLNEFKYFCSYFNTRNIEQRNEQVALYFRLKTSIEAAKSIAKIKEQLKLTKEFDELNVLLKMGTDVSKEWNLLKMNEEVKATVDIVSKLDSKEKLECLETFIKSSKIVEWLKANAANIMELKFLVDLASESIESNSEHHLLPHTLKDAGTGFAALVYDLKLDDDFQTFMGHCIKVWDYLKDDPHISEKLLNISGMIEQLNEIKTKSNVEVSSIELTKMFNEKGVYKIRLQSCMKRIEEAIVLEIEEKNYNYNQLKDQQAILMLMARKTTEKVDDESKVIEYFLEIFDGITHLADLGLKLIHSGCILFNEFEVVFFCDFLNDLAKTAKPVCSINFKNEIEIIDKLSTTKNALHNLCSFMDDCIHSWQEHVVKLREKFDCLNYLTINQIGFLRRSLATLVRIKIPSDNDEDQIRWLLTNFNSNITLDELLNALDNISDKMPNEDIHATQQFLNHFEKENPKFSTELINMAINEHGIVSAANVFQYCVEHENDSIERDNLTVLKRLKRVWQQFKSENSKISKHYLSIEQVALVLQSLWSKSDFQRDIPGYLTTRQPNLIFCSSAEQMSTVLSIYAQSGIRCPLPKNDECLFCTSETTGEEVEIFLRVALKSDGKKIYTLLNIQDLNYEAANHADKWFPKIHSTKNYILVVVCCIEKKSHNVLISTFLKYKIPQHIKQTEENLQNYLMLQYKSSTTSSALILDPNQLAVRTLIS